MAFLALLTKFGPMVMNQAIPALMAMKVIWYYTRNLPLKLFSIIIHIIWHFLDDIIGRSCARWSSCSWRRAYSGRQWTAKRKRPRKRKRSSTSRILIWLYHQNDGISMQIKSFIWSPRGLENFSKRLISNYTNKSICMSINLNIFSY